MRGQFENSERLNLDQTMVPDDYGIDWDGPASADADTEDHVDVADTNCPLPQDQLNQLATMFHQNCPQNPSPWECVRMYQLIKNFTLQQS